MNQYPRLDSNVRSFKASPVHGIRWQVPRPRQTQPPSSVMVAGVRTHLNVVTTIFPDCIRSPDPPAPFKVDGCFHKCSLSGCYFFNFLIAISLKNTTSLSL